jgi:lysophospholipase L1-like esterase
MAYYYVVSAVNNYGESADSAIVSVAIPNSNDLQDVCVAMGDSITTGWGSANYADTYVPRLSAIFGKTVYNKGANTTDGPQSSYGAALIDGILAQYNPKYITIFFGANDVGFYSVDWTIGNLRYVIQRAKSHGAKPVVATLTPVFGQWAWRKPYVVALNQRIRQLASEEGINCADLEATFGWDSAYIISDGMHPNSAGHLVIANTFYGALIR